MSSSNMDAQIAEVMSRYGIDPDDTKRPFTFSEMRLLAKGVLDQQRQYRRLKQMRLGALIFLVVLFCVAVVATSLAYVVTKTTQVKADGAQAALVQKGGHRVVSTAESAEDIDASVLVDYKRDGTDANGQPDGEWVLSDARLAMLRSIAWREDGQTHIHRVSQVSRFDGENAHVELLTRAGHKLRIWDSDGEDNFNVEIKRRNPETGQLDEEWSEILPEGDDDERGVGRVLVSLRRPNTKEPAKQLAVGDYDLD